MRVGLLGGSFDPPHLGHVHISHQALARFRLDQVWWLVSLGNPLKQVGPAGMARRLAACRALVSHPNIQVSDLEARFQTRRTADTLARLLPVYPGVKFVWLMGADNLAEFHRWQNWRDIADSVPLGVLGRRGRGLAATASKTARTYRHARLLSERSYDLALCAAPAWCLVNGPTLDVSSTAIRNKGEWVR